MIIIEPIPFYKKKTFKTTRRNKKHKLENWYNPNMDHKSYCKASDGYACCCL